MSGTRMATETSRKRIVAGAGLSVGAVLALPATAAAEDIQVTNLNEDGPGSFFDALIEGNSDPDFDRIVFKSKLSGTIEWTGTEGFPIAGGDLEIVGPGARRVAITRSGGVGTAILVAFTAPTTPGALDVTVSGLTLKNTESGYNGGAIAAYSNEGPTNLTLSRVTISGNEATGEIAANGHGGAVSARTDDTEGSLTIENSTISGNSAVGLGGGIYTGVDLSVQNSTITGNATEANGGGAYLLGTFSSEFRSTTVTGNEATTFGGGITDASSTAPELRGTIVAGNTAGDDGPDIDFGTFDLAFSVIGDTSGASFNDEGGNLLDVDPLLKPLANNGGPTDTHAFKKSPAKNKGPSDAPDKDQRGAPRKGQPDIGAYEFTKCKGVIVNRVGTSGKDKLKGTKRKDGMLGLGGNDKLKGKKGKDGLCGGRGKDKLIGGPGKDKFNGGPGKDKEVQ